MKNFLKRQWPLLGLGFLLVLVAFYLITSKKTALQEAIVESITPAEGIRVQDFHYDQNNPDKGLTWTLAAKEMKTTVDKKIISFSDFRMKVTPKDRASFELTGAKGSYSQESGEINLWGALEGSSEQGYRMTTEHILFNEKIGQVTTDKPIKISGPFFSVQGRGLTVDLEKETVKIRSNVTTLIDMGPLT